MVKEQGKGNGKRQGNQGKAGCPAKASKIGYSTPYSYCSERLSPFGGLLGLVKFMELIQFKEIFEGLYNPPSRTPERGHHRMVYGFIMLLFIGFNRVWHFLYIQYRLAVVFDFSCDQTSLCNDILAVCKFTGDKSREVIVAGNECTQGAVCGIYAR